MINYEEFVRNRISQLRIQKEVSEYQMSLDLGQNRGYINSITSGKSMPSMKIFFAICEYFDITPMEFFNEEIVNPELVSKAVDGFKKLDDSDTVIIMNFMERLLKNRKQ